MIITIFKNIKQSSNPFYRECEVIFDRIKNGNSKTIVEKIRKSKDKEQSSAHKRSLPSICFSGKFKVRNKQSCLLHSGIICLDFDKYKTTDLMNIDRKKLCDDKYTHCLFTSPSGNGLKVLVKIPPSIDDHTAHFKALDEYYNNDNFDKATSDVSRACFESSDPDIYINKESELFTAKVEDEQHEFCNRQPMIPVESSNQIIMRLQKWFDRKYGMGEGSRNQNIFIFASSMNEFGIDYIDAISYLEQYTEKDFSKSEIERTVKSAYANKGNAGTKYFENNNARDEINKSVKSGKELKKIYKEFSDKYTPEQIDTAIKETEANSTILEFWYENAKGKPVILNLKFKQFLEQQGYAKYYPAGSEHFVFIKSENNFIEHTTDSRIKDFVLQYLEDRNEIAVYEIMARDRIFFTESYLSQLNTIEIPFFEDTKDYAMLYYQNCAVQVTKKGAKQIDYLNLDGMIWKHHVIMRDYVKSSFAGSMFDLFLDRVSETDECKKALKSSMGYLMHSYKALNNNKAIIYNDRKISENPNGGSGKGIICDAISQIKRSFKIDGKLFSFDKGFMFQSVNIETQVLIFDDTKKNFKFENLFSVITEGITLEKKNRDEIKLPNTRSPKIVVTTNYSIGGTGGSFERRKYEVELSDFFNENHTPFDEFGKMLIYDFDKSEYAEFDNLMVSCIVEYLTHGLIKIVYKNTNDKKLIKDTCHEFFVWSGEGNLRVGEKYVRSERYAEFIVDYPDYAQRGKLTLSNKRFNGWVDTYALYLSKEVKNFRDKGARSFMIGDSKTPELRNYTEPQEKIVFDDLPDAPPLY